jgi:hypothetical protein
MNHKNIEGKVSLVYDATDTRFIETFEAYKRLISPHANKGDFLNYVAKNFLIYGYYQMIEGIGYIGLDGQFFGEPESGISAKEILT